MIATSILDGFVAGLLIGVACAAVLVAAALVLSSVAVSRKRQEEFNAGIRRASQERGDLEKRRECYRQLLQPRPRADLLDCQDQERKEVGPVYDPTPVRVSDWPYHKGSGAPLRAFPGQ